jgi:aldehyde dehydrogenase (NAD+)
LSRAWPPGNAAILKPSELTPATSALIARMIAETFPPDLVTVVEGDKTVAERLLALPFDHIFFTGSPAVGQDRDGGGGETPGLGHAGAGRQVPGHRRPGPT